MEEVTQPDIDKIRRCAVLIMNVAARGDDFAAWSYAGWINQYCQEILYEDMYQPPPRE